MHGAYVVSAVEASRPGRLGPIPGGRSGCWLVLHGLEGAEADLELVVAQRRLQHCREESFARRIVGAQLVQPGKSADAFDSSGGGGRLDLVESVVGRLVQWARYGSLSRCDENRGVPTRGVDQRDIVGLRNRDSPQCADRLFDGGAGLEHVAQNDGDTESFASAR